MYLLLKIAPSFTLGLRAEIRAPRASQLYAVLLRSTAAALRLSGFSGSFKFCKYYPITPLRRYDNLADHSLLEEG